MLSNPSDPILAALIGGGASLSAAALGYLLNDRTRHRRDVVPKRSRVWLRPDEYTRMLSAGGGSPRDCAILQVFLQTGVRVKELGELRVADVDLTAKVLHVRAAKGRVGPDVALERKGIRAIKTWLSVRPNVREEHLCLNRYGETISDRGVRQLIAKYRAAGGITKRATPHSLRHTFASYEAKVNVTPYMLKEMPGQKKLSTTPEYTHLAKQDDQRVMEATSL